MQAARGLLVLWMLILAGALIVEFNVSTSAGYAAGDFTDQVARRKNAPPDRAPVLIAAGDVADCQSPGAEETATLIRDIAGTIATLGDNAYPTGSSKQFSNCYDPTWGTEKNRTQPAVGNHEYGTRDTRGYFDYFGKVGGGRGEGYYSYELGAWHIVVLNSNCDEIDGCDENSPQGMWLRADLADHPATCTLAYWHHPLFSSGMVHGGDAEMRPIWQMLYDRGADVVLSGHEHNYERFAPQDPNGTPDLDSGIRAFVVGTGGVSHYPFGPPLPTSEVRNADTFGVLVLTLRPKVYKWEFIPVNAGVDQRAEKAFADSGSMSCH